MIKKILLSLLAVAVVGGAYLGYIAYSKIKGIQTSFEVAGGSPLIPITEEALKEGNRIVEGEISDPTNLYRLHDVYLRIFSEEINTLVKMQEESERKLCMKFDASKLTVSYDAVEAELKQLRALPTGNEAEMAAYIVVLGTVHLQLPIVTSSISAARGFCAE